MGTRDTFPTSPNDIAILDRSGINDFAVGGVTDGAFHRKLCLIRYRVTKKTAFISPQGAETQRGKP